VHAIHLEPSHFAKLKRVCACPSTEANLGDGVLAADALIRAGCSVSLGSDSQARISLLDEARLLEEHLRLVRGRRAVLDPGTGAADGLAARLFSCASVAGATALGVDTGTLAVGQPADFFTLRGVGSVADAVFGGERACDVAVQGRLIVRDGAHTLAEAAGRGLDQVIAQLAS
jgi:formimidoylglutamate deiminase